MIKEYQKRFYEKYYDEETGFIKFEGLLLFKKEGKGERKKFLKLYQGFDPDQYMRESDVGVFPIYFEDIFNQKQGVLVGYYCGVG